MDSNPPSSASRRPIAILSFDGGGLIGLSSLLILQELMYQLNSSPEIFSRGSSGVSSGPLRPCDIFDVIGGTSIGGIFAAMFGTLEMTVSEAIASYRSGVLFRDRGSSETDDVHTTPLFDDDAFDQTLDRIVRSRINSTRQILGISRTVILSRRTSIPKNGGVEGHINVSSNFRSGSTLDIDRLVTACHASCALPGLLTPVRRRAAGSMEEYSAVDNGNVNPVSTVIEETRQLFPGRKIGIVVSIGSGRPPFKDKRNDNRRNAAFRATEEAYSAAETEAQKMSAELDLLSWTNYHRFSITEFSQRTELDELAKYSHLYTMIKGYCAGNVEKFRECLNSIHLNRCVEWNTNIIFEEDGTELFDAIARGELLSVKRLLQRCDTLFSAESPVLTMPPLLLEGALRGEERARKISGQQSKELSVAVEVTEWVRHYLQKHPRHQPSWDIPADPKKHSRIRIPWSCAKPNLKELCTALVPCHKSTLEHAQYVLNNFLDLVFACQARAEWIWTLAQRSDREVHAGEWLKNISPESLRISSEVLTLVGTRLSRRFPGGPWSSMSSLSHEGNLTPPCSTELEQDKPRGTIALPDRDEKQVNETYELVQTEYVRDNPLLSQDPELIQGFGQPLNQSVDRTPSKRYSYSPLPPGNFIRVIILFPATSEHDHLRCDIEFLDLDREFYTYDGISYCWGETGIDEILYCGPQFQKLKITPTLASALRKFRGLSGSRRLWADAVCINQCDLQEKARQVALISLIYKRARSTLIHLGEPLPGQEKYMRFVRKLALLVGDHAQASGDMAERNNRLIKEAMTEAFGKVDMSLVAQLTELPWFHRRWIIPEAALCKISIAFFGRSIGRLDDLVIAMTALANSSLNAHRAAQGALHSVDVIYLLRNSQPQWMKHRSSFGIVDLLIKCHAAETSEPKDRLFALLSVAPDINRTGNENAAINLWPDYSKTLVETYIDFAIQCLQSSPTLDLLHCAGSFRQPNSSSPSINFMANGAMGLPSFVPDWTARRRYLPLANVIRFTAGLSAIPSGPRTIERHKLCLQGRFIATVQVRTTSFPETLLPTMVPDVIDLCLQLHERYCDWARIDGSARRVPLEAFCRTLIADHALLGSSVILNDWFQSSDHNHELGPDHTERISEELFAGFQLILEDYEDSGGRGMQFLRSFDEGDWNTCYQMLYAQAFCATMQGRSFFMTSRGHMGIAPDDIEVGDVVAVFLGVRTPFILRPHPSQRHGPYKIVGDCYVDGLMGGEVLASPRHRAVSFVLQ